MIRRDYEYELIFDWEDRRVEERVMYAGCDRYGRVFDIRGTFGWWHG